MSESDSGSAYEHVETGEGVKVLDKPAEETRQKLLKNTIDKVLETLTYREREIIKLRKGLGEGYTYTREEVARIFKIDCYRVGKIEARAMRKLQHPVRSDRLQEFRSILATDGPPVPVGYYYLLLEVIDSHANQLEPNLFDFATSELSQDAFICWLLAWAHLHQRWNDAALHQTAVVLLKRMLALHMIDPPTEYKRLEIERQFPVQFERRLDILVLVNDDIALLIEDKKDTIQHSDQLRLYLDGVEKAFPKRRLAPVYLQLGDQDCYQEVEEAGWKCFRRMDVLRVLEYGKHHGVVSDIFRDFHSHLFQIDLKSWKNRVHRSC